MTNKSFYQNKLTLNRSTLQLSLNFNIQTCFDDDGKVGLVQDLVERMDLTKLIKSYSNLGRKPAVDPITMLQVLIYCYSEGKFSSREIEKFCKFDLRAKYLLNGKKAPDHATINRYRQRLEPFIEDILSENTKILVEDGHIDLSSIYIDGTKVEAYANRYTFVWKKAVLKYQENLRLKIINHFNLDLKTTPNEVKNHVEEEFKSVKKDAKNIEFVYGRGKRKTQIQRNFETYESWIKKLNEYENHLEIMGERNSYSKTDHDATFMRMKEDHMKNGQLKPAYNIQLASTGQFVVGVYGSHHPSDMHTLPLFLRKLSPKYKDELDKIVCDSGYESIENYTYLKEHNLRAFIKPSNYEISKTRKFKKDISKKENMIYDEDKDYYICANNKKLIRQEDRVHTRKSGFKEVQRVYRCFECNNCPYQKQCNKYSKKDNPQTKSLRYNEEFNKLRQESYENITSEEGIDERLNRSIQAEGMFSKMKEGLEYDRFRHRGLKGVLCDINLLVLGINLNKLHKKLLNNQYEIIKYTKAA